MKQRLLVIVLSAFLILSSTFGTDTASEAKSLLAPEGGPKELPVAQAAEPPDPPDLVVRLADPPPTSPAAQINEMLYHVGRHTNECANGLFPLHQEFWECFAIPFGSSCGWDAEGSLFWFAERVVASIRGATERSHPKSMMAAQYAFILAAEEALLLEEHDCAPNTDDMILREINDVCRLLAELKLEQEELQPLPKHRHCYVSGLKAAVNGDRLLAEVCIRAYLERVQKNDPKTDLQREMAVTSRLHELGLLESKVRAENAMQSTQAEKELR